MLGNKTKENNEKGGNLILRQRHVRLQPIFFFFKFLILKYPKRSDIAELGQN